MVYPNLTKEEQERAGKEREKLKKKAVYWHNSIPTFNQDMRPGLTGDVQTITNIRQFELNEELSRGIKWNNILNIVVSVVNLIFFGFNIFIYYFR
ncbi:MAG: hypothetical protein KAQ92_06555 [Candidatus Aenigmarchaeota archaeon]|nr:hypothetical protein [Candidatus Aenigmarchaeota archaeon]